MKKTVFYLLIVLFSQSAFAQSVNTHMFRFSDTLETIQVEDALGPNSELFKHRFMLRLSYDFVGDPMIRLDADRNNQTGTIVNDIHTFTMGGGVMLSDRIYFGLTVPLHFSDIDASEVLAADPDAWELGDIHWKLKLRLSGDDRNVNFAFMPWGFVPTGRNDQENNYLISDDSFGWGGRFLADTTFGRVSFYGNAGLSYANNAQFVTIDRRLRIDTGLGAFVRITDIIGANAEVINGFTVSSFEKDQNPVSIQVGLRAKLGIVRAFAGLGLEGLRGARSNDKSFYFGLKMPFGNREKPEPPVEEEIEPLVRQKIEILKENLSIRREINFQTDKDVILPESFGELDSAAEIILQYQEYIDSITIEGHTDSRGSDAHNQDLSERRAASVKRYLVEKGVPAEKLKSVGYGESRLKVVEVDAETLRINRRVEFIVNETIEIEKQTEVIEYPDGTIIQSDTEETINVR